MDSDGYKIPRRFHVSSNMLGEFAQKRGRGVIVETMAMLTRDPTLSLMRRSRPSRATCRASCAAGLRCELGASCDSDPRWSGILFFMFIRAQPYTCLGIEWLTQGGESERFTRA